MVIYILTEPGFETSSWYKQIFSGLMSEKRTKRITMLDLKDTSDLLLKEFSVSDVLLIIGTNEKWILDCISICEYYFKNRIIILGNYRPYPHKKISVITGDIANDVLLLYNYLRHCNKKRIALYGVNQYSSSDLCRKNSFLSITNSEADIYYNHGSLSDCFKTFSANAEKYDGVICVNDYAAISLVSHLENKNLFIVSCSGTELSKLCKPSITNMKINYEEFGSACLELIKMLEKNSNITSANIYLSSVFTPGETTQNIPMSDNISENTINLKEDDPFYSDEEIEQMMKIEKLLLSCSPEDLKIIERVVNNATYAELSDEFYLSISGIKYKLKKMFETCGVKNKNTFTELLKKHIKN